MGEELDLKFVSGRPLWLHPGGEHRGCLALGRQAKRAVPYSHLQGARRWPKSSPPPSPPLSWLNALRTRLACLDLRLRASASLPGCAPVRHVRSGSWLFIESKRAANSTSATAPRVLCQRLPLRGLRGFRVYSSKFESTTVVFSHSMPIDLDLARDISRRCSGTRLFLDLSNADPHTTSLRSLSCGGLSLFSAVPLQLSTVSLQPKRPC